MNLHEFMVLVLDFLLCAILAPKEVASICLFPIRLIYYTGCWLTKGILHRFARIAERRRRQNGYVPTWEENDLLWDTAEAEVARHRMSISARIKLGIVKEQATMWETRKLPVKEIREALAAQEAAKNDTNHR